MSDMVEIARRLRRDLAFKGYIHLKTIPDASQELIDQAGASCRSHFDQCGIAHGRECEGLRTREGSSDDPEGDGQDPPRA